MDVIVALVSVRYINKIDFIFRRGCELELDSGGQIACDRITARHLAQLLFGQLDVLFLAGLEQGIRRVWLPASGLSYALDFLHWLAISAEHHSRLFIE